MLSDEAPYSAAPDHPDALYLSVGKSSFLMGLEAYLLCGGFLEIVLADEALRPLILEEYSSLSRGTMKPSHEPGGLQANDSRPVKHIVN